MTWLEPYLLVVWETALFYVLYINYNKTFLYDHDILSHLTKKTRVQRGSTSKERRTL